MSEAGTQGAGQGKMVRAKFELAVVGRPRRRTRIFGHVVRGMMVEEEVELTDPDGTGTFTGSVRVEYGVERAVGVVVRYDGLSDLVEDFGLVEFDRDRTFFSSVPILELYRL